MMETTFLGKFAEKRQGCPENEMGTLPQGSVPVSGCGRRVSAPPRAAAFYEPPFFLLSANVEGSRVISAWSRFFPMMSLSCSA